MCCEWASLVSSRPLERSSPLILGPSCQPHRRAPGQAVGILKRLLCSRSWNLKAALVPPLRYEQSGILIRCGTSRLPRLAAAVHVSDESPQSMDHSPPPISTQETSYCPTTCQVLVQDPTKQILGSYCCWHGLQAPEIFDACSCRWLRCCG